MKDAVGLFASTLAVLLVITAFGYGGVVVFMFAYGTPPAFIAALFVCLSILNLLFLTATFVRPRMAVWRASLATFIAALIIIPILQLYVADLDYWKFVAQTIYWMCPLALGTVGLYWLNVRRPGVKSSVPDRPTASNQG